MDIPNEKLMEGYYYLLNNTTGDQKSLEDIYPGLVEYLIQNSLISEGIDSTAGLRYRLTDLGKEIVKENYLTLASDLCKEDCDAIFS